MLRKIITPQTQDYILRIPAEYLNTQIEILVLPFSNKEEDSDIDLNGDSIKKTADILAGHTIDPLLWQKQIRDKWN